MQFYWKDGHGRSVPAQMVGEIVEHIESQQGVCNPRNLVEQAEPLSSPIHNLFEWDDKLAGLEYRVEQARGIMQSLRVVIEGDGLQPAPAFVHVRLEGSGPGYVSVVRALNDVQMRAAVLKDALTQLSALETRYATLKELKPVWQAIARVKRPHRAGRVVKKQVRRAASPVR